MSTGATELDINILLEQLEISEEVIRFNTAVENDITKNGGKIVYSYNNIIMASEISDEYYNELSKNPLIESIYVVPLKRYGDIDNKLIGQIDLNKFTILTGSTSGITIGEMTSQLNKNQIKPSITSSLTLTAITNKEFTYFITASGSTPITFEANWMIVPTDSSRFNFEGSVIIGKIVKNGKYTINLKAKNPYGIDSKKLIVTVNDDITPIITSDLIAYGVSTSAFTYQIENAFTATTYRAYGMPNALTINTTGLISGTILDPGGVYSFPIITSNSFGSDQKTLELRVLSSGTTTATKPIITSSGRANGVENEDFAYYIIAEGAQVITYSVTGTLPEGLSLKNNCISGTPITPTIKTVKINATNYKGTTSKDLQITIKNSKPPHGGS